MELHDDGNSWNSKNKTKWEGKSLHLGRAVEDETTYQTEEVTGPNVGDLDLVKLHLEITMAQDNEAQLEPIVEQPKIKPLLDSHMTNSLIERVWSPCSLPQPGTHMKLRAPRQKNRGNRRRGQELGELCRCWASRNFLPRDRSRVEVLQWMIRNEMLNAVWLSARVHWRTTRREEKNRWWLYSSPTGSNEDFQLESPFEPFQTLYDLLKKEDPDLVFLQETKVKASIFTSKKFNFDF